jgi:hypothetical protein
MPPARHQSPPDPALQQRAWAALVLGALSLLGLSLGMGGNPHRVIYVVVLALLIGATAAWLGLTSTSKARRSGASRPRGAIGGTVLGFIGLAFSLLALAAFIAFWPQLNQLSNCMAGANTLSAQQACQSQFSNSVGNEFSLLQGNG